MCPSFTNEVTTQQKAIQAIPQNLWRLGLLCDEEILERSQKPADRLRRNRDLLVEMQQLSSRSRSRMSMSLAKTSGQGQVELRNAYLALMEYYRRGDIQTLQRLSIQQVEQLISASQPKTPKPPKLKGETPTPESEPAYVLRGRQFLHTVAACVVSGDLESEKDLRQLGEALSEQLALDPNSSGSGLTLKEHSVEYKPDRTYEPALKLMEQVVGPDQWGGVLSSLKPEIKDALQDVAPERVAAYDPQDPNQGVKGQALFTLLRQFDRYLGTVKASFSLALNRLIAHRKMLVEHLDLLLTNPAPLILFGGDLDARRAMNGYLDAYAEILRMLHQHEATLHGRDPDATTFVISNLLRLDVIYIKVESDRTLEWKAMLSPLHPLNLWRYREIFKTVKERKLTDDEKEQLSKALPDLPHLLHFLVVIGDVTEGVQLMLPRAGAVGLLPTYENHTNRFLGNDGIEFLQEILPRWLNDAPYTRAQIRLALIDVPDLADAVDKLHDFLGRQNSDTHVMVEAYYTRKQNAVGQLTALDYTGDDADIAELILSGRLTINIHHLGSLSDVVDTLCTRPVHIAFAFDQALYQIGNGPRATQLVVSPLVITYQYEYSESFKQGSIVPSSESTEDGLFSDFNFLVERAANSPAGQQVRLKYGDDANVRPLNALLQRGGAGWLVIADRSVNPYAPQAAIPLGEHRVGQREIAIWARSMSQSVDRYVRVLKRFNLSPQRENVAELLRHFGHIASSGLIGLSVQTTGAHPERDEREKGLLGTVIAAAWYSERYPDALVASLDTTLGRQWLHQRADAQDRADLIGLRMQKLSDGSDTWSSSRSRSRPVKAAQTLKPKPSAGADIA